MKPERAKEIDDHISKIRDMLQEEWKNTSIEKGGDVLDAYRALQTLIGCVNIMRSMRK